MEKVKKQEPESLFVGYNEAIALKELGFDEPCLASYETAFGKGIDFELGYIIDGPKNYVLAPLYQQAFRWFREKHGLNSYIYQRSNITYRGVIHKNMKIAVNYTSDSSNYEEAESACLDKLIEILKAKKT